jgi:hypothetical protein
MSNAHPVPAWADGKPVVGQLVGAWLSFHHARPTTMFRTWRHGRAFWGGTFTLLAAVEMLSITKLKLGGLTIHEGVTGVPAMLMAVLLIIMAMAMWFTPLYHGFAGIMACLIAVGALILSNLGGFFVGTLLGLLGGALGFAWTPNVSTAEIMGVGVAKPTEAGAQPATDAGAVPDVEAPTGAEDDTQVTGLHATDGDVTEPIGVRPYLDTDATSPVGHDAGASYLSSFDGEQTDSQTTDSASIPTQREVNLQ